MSERRPGLEIVNAVADDAVAVHGLIEELARTTGLAGKFSGTVDAYLKYGFGPSPLFERLESPFVVYQVKPVSCP